MERRGQPARWVGQAPHRGEGGLDGSSVGPGGSLGPWGRREGTPTGGPPDQRSPGLWESRLQRGGADLEVGRPGSWIPGYPSEPRTLEGLVIFFNSLLSILSCCILNTWGRGRGKVVSSASGCLPLGWEPGTQELLALVWRCQQPRKTTTPVSRSSLGRVSDALLSAPLVLAWGPPNPHSSLQSSVLPPPASFRNAHPRPQHVALQR